MAGDDGTHPNDPDDEHDDEPNDPEDQEKEGEEPTTRKALDALRQQFESTAHFICHLMEDDLLNKKLRLICL